MNKRIAVGDEVYALLISNAEVKDGTEWIGNHNEPLQGSRMKYESGKTFRTHHHILNPRIIKRTQEAFVIITGRLAVDVYDNKAALLGTLEAGPGEAIFVYRGGHGVRVVESGIFYEIKAGQFDGVLSEEKAFLND